MPNSKRVNSALAFLLVTTGLVVLLIIHLGVSRYAAFRSHQAELARHSVAAASQEIALLLSERRRTVQLFVEENLATIRRLAENPGDPVLYRSLLDKVERHFSDLVAYMVADQDGHAIPALPDHGVGNACRRDIQAFSQRGDHIISLHQTPQASYLHYDIMVPVRLDGASSGVFLASFRTQDLARLLRTSQLQSHRLMLSDTGQPHALQISGQGEHPAADRPTDGWVATGADLAQSAPVAGTGWSVADHPDAHLFQDMALSLWSEMLGMLVLFVVSGTLMYRRIAREEANRAMAEAALQRANDTLEQRVRERTGALTEANQCLEHEMAERERAEQRDREHLLELCHVTRLNTMGEMASALAHEINQPLAAIANYASGCVRRLEHDSSDRQALRDVMVQVVAHAEQAGGIIKRLRHFLRKGDAQRSTVDIHAVIQSVIGLLGPQAQQRDVTLVYQPGHALPSVQADRIQLEQAILNLVCNGIEVIAWGATAERRVTIETAQTDAETLTVSVSDTGPGLQAEMLAAVFEPFFTTKRDGMGLGLSISRSIVENLGGRLWAESAGVTGTTFRFTLPVRSS